MEDQNSACPETCSPNVHFLSQVLIIVEAKLYLNNQVPKLLVGHMVVKLSIVIVELSRISGIIEHLKGRTIEVSNANGKHLVNGGHKLPLVGNLIRTSGLLA